MRTFIFTTVEAGYHWYGPTLYGYRTWQVQAETRREAWDKVRAETKLPLSLREIES
jgi:hypothetical protein